MNKKNNKRSGKYNDEKNPLEWSVFAASLLFVLAITGYLVYAIIVHRLSPPVLEIRYEKEPAPVCPYRYHVYVTNKGGQTAKDVKIEARLLQKEQVSESSDMEIGFLPKRSFKEGWILFATDPAAADRIEIRVVSYKTP